MNLQRIIDFFLPQTIIVDHREKLIAGTAAFISIFSIATISYNTIGASGLMWMGASVGAASVLIFAAPHSPFSQPWALLGGHLISAVVGVTCAQWIPDIVLATALAGGGALLAMYFLRCLHPPGGAVAVAAVVGGPAITDLGYQFVLMPVAINTVMLLMAALIANNLIQGRHYPNAPKRDAQSRRQPLDGNIDFHPFKDEDLDAALAEINTYIDASREDLYSIFEKALLHAQRRRLGHIYAKDIMNEKPTVFVFDTGLDEAWHEMIKQGIKGAPVVDSFQRVIGVITVKDFVHHVLPQTGKTLKARIINLIKPTVGFSSDKAEVVGQLMSAPAITVDKEIHAIELVGLFNENQIHHIPVVDKRRYLCGLITRADIIRVLLYIEN